MATLPGTMLNTITMEHLITQFNDYLLASKLWVACQFTKINRFINILE